MKIKMKNLRMELTAAPSSRFFHTLAETWKCYAAFGVLSVLHVNTFSDVDLQSGGTFSR